MPKIKPQALKNTFFFWARQGTTFPVHHLLVGSLYLDVAPPPPPPSDKFLRGPAPCNKQLLELKHLLSNNLEKQQIQYGF